ncbi:DUF763 domain-containing protein [Pyrobaculum aerophilum]|uniref:DUF763 domain-containing protein n=2 Tax=Pyrobaculum aerophilum TaxID=13773 RepID=Q8ZYH9_PYRAE|nr:MULTISPECIES: DUF763 domain-containing protein [Pyrobaculum]AAL63014.1 conserved hypothetical protein [Pyrobaculum aerophilum str. IM2]MCX8136209.1 DUF763 domain-containing protein [Pyrobaculum aerophilum]HII48215.1 DUF763 domain-containing protein [Pyrobaculum aerophilum]
MKLSGIADLPLHDGHVPYWLLARMKKLSSLILRIMYELYGPDGIVDRFAHPVFFQAFNNVIGMDWDSSGSTTVTTAVVKEALWKSDIPVKVAGGKGRHALNTPKELMEIARLFDLDANELVVKSRLAAKVDGALLQDGYELYHHAFIVSETGKWGVIQQGLNPDLKMARRYHWLSTEDFFNSPHAGVVGIRHEKVLNLASKNSKDNRAVILELINEGASKVARYLYLLRGQATLFETPYYHPYIKLDIDIKAVVKNLPPPKSVADFKELLLQYRIGPKTLRALSLVAELIFKTPADWNDPAVDPFKFAFAVGGKDGVPSPIDKRVYDELITLLDAVVEKARGDPGLYRYLSHLAKKAESWKYPSDKKRPTL